MPGSINWETAFLGEISFDCIENFLRHLTRCSWYITWFIHLLLGYLRGWNNSYISLLPFSLSEMINAWDYFNAEEEPEWSAKEGECLILWLTSDSVQKILKICMADSWPDYDVYDQRHMVEQKVDYRKKINFWQGNIFNAFALLQCHFYRYFGASLTFIDNSVGQSTNYIYSLDYS